MTKLDEILKGTYARYIAKDFSRSSLSINKRIPLIVDNINVDNFFDVQKQLFDCFGDIEVTSVFCEKGKQTTANCCEDGKQTTADSCENGKQTTSVFCEDGKQPTAVCLGHEKQTRADCCVHEIQSKISELKASDCISIVVDGRGLTKHKRFDFSDLVEVMRQLRAENGCEWDRAQTHKSIRINLIEEAYELVEAIDCDSSTMMLEESGDVLMQAVFHTAIAEEKNEFNFSDMLTALCRKLIDRHTHIFGDNHAQTAEEALTFWNEAKKVEKKYLSTSDAMSRIPKNLPALLYAEKMQKLAKKCGFDFDNVETAICKVHEELQELIDADSMHKAEESGDLVFAVVNVLRFFKIEPEMALHEANMKFYRRFCAVEALASKNGKKMKDCTFGELDSFWDIVKQAEISKAELPK